MLVAVLFSEPLSLEFKPDFFKLDQSALREGPFTGLGVNNWAAGLHYYYFIGLIGSDKYRLTKIVLSEKYRK